MGTAYTKKDKKNLDGYIAQFQEGEKGYFLFFRKMAMRMQERFSDIFEHSDMAKVLIHGNPHTENYVITKEGAGMTDFDRSRIGAYGWDIVRFLCSLSLKREEENTSELLPPIVLEYFKEGYLRSFHAPTLPFKGFSHEESDKVEYKVWYDSTKDYLEANKKWSKRLRQNPIEEKDKKLNKILAGYLESRYEEELLNQYNVEEAGTAEGTFGNSRYLAVLTHKKDKKADNIFVEVKTVYQDKDTQYYYNPYKHHGLRMIKASKIYAPKLEQRLGYTTYQGVEYWGREIPACNGKLKVKLDTIEQLDIAFSVGTQLGKAHRRTLTDGSKPKHLVQHFLANYEKMCQVSQQLNKELLTFFNQYISN
ncbi:MAG: hypothetical protein ACJAWV_003084 [Flammeovirgaceae bacterium]|jgi:hypothetical protein